jgi:hypothetical protein
MCFDRTTRAKATPCPLSPIFQKLIRCTGFFFFLSLVARRDLDLALCGRGSIARIFGPLRSGQDFREKAIVMDALSHSRSCVMHNKLPWKTNVT